MKLRINNQFLKKHLLSLIVITILIIGAGIAFGTINSKAADRGDDPVNSVNQDRYQVLVSGEGYTLSKNQEKNYELQKKQNKENALKAADKPNTLNNPNSSRVFRSNSNYRTRYKGHTYKKSENPKLTSNISAQIKKVSEWKKGDKLRFRVSAFAYPYKSKDCIPSSNIKIKVNGRQTATLYKSKGDYYYYLVEIGEGSNRITISVTDKKKKQAKLGPFIVKGGKNSSNESNQSEKPSGSGESGGNTVPSTNPPKPEEPAKNAVTVDFGFGIFQSDEMVIEDSTTVYDVLSKTPGVKLNGQKIEYITVDNYQFDGNVLTDIYEKEVDDPNTIDFETWKKDNVDQRVNVNGKVRLGPGYPFDSTRWEVSAGSGKNLISGITLKLVLYDD